MYHSGSGEQATYACQSGIACSSPLYTTPLTLHCPCSLPEIDTSTQWGRDILLPERGHVMALQEGTCDNTPQAISLL